MNGRVYDPALGRMLSADPFVQFPTSTQSFNRYSYVLNNPLSFTDPSGFSLGSDTPGGPNDLSDNTGNWDRDDERSDSEFGHNVDRVNIIHPGGGYYSHGEWHPGEGHDTRNQSHNPPQPDAPGNSGSAGNWNRDGGDGSGMGRGLDSGDGSISSAGTGLDGGGNNIGAHNGNSPNSARLVAMASTAGMRLTVKGAVKNLLSDFRVRGVLSFGASLIADYAAKNMEPGISRGIVYSIAGLLALDSSIAFGIASIGSFYVATVTPPVLGPVGAAVSVYMGYGFAAAAVYDAYLSVGYFEQAEQDFGWGASSEPPT